MTSKFDQGFKDSEDAARYAEELTNRPKGHLPMNPLASLFARLFATSDPITGEVRASVEKLVAGLAAMIPGVVGILDILGVVGGENSEALTQSILAALTGSPEWITLMVLGALWWRKRDQQDRNELSQ